MAIKKGKRTLRYEKEWSEFLERSKEEYNEVHCPRHGLILTRKDLPAQCPSCSPMKGDNNE